MKEIGGFFELEIPTGKEYHVNAPVKLNYGRNALSYLIQIKKIKKIYLPFYCCSSILETVYASNINFEFYHIDNQFYPISTLNLLENEYILYINYFGVNDIQVRNMVNNHKNIIIDNTQSFYSKPIKHVDTFYSARKFFGVPDGSYLYTDILMTEKLSTHTSYNYMSHLLKRIDLSAAEAYVEYTSNEENIKNIGLKEMSSLTQRLLNGIDYKNIKKIRKQNFDFLHKNLGSKNELSFDLEESSVPMVYPFKIATKGLRKFLISNSIFVATYWNEVLNIKDVSDYEKKLVEFTLPLPIDQRYSLTDMLRIVSLINNFLTGEAKCL